MTLQSTSASPERLLCEKAGPGCCHLHSHPSLSISHLFWDLTGFHEGAALANWKPNSSQALPPRILPTNTPSAGQEDGSLAKNTQLLVLGCLHPMHTYCMLTPEDLSTAGVQCTIYYPKFPACCSYTPDSEAKMVREAVCRVTAAFSLKPQEAW